MIQAVPSFSSTPIMVEKGQQGSTTDYLEGIDAISAGNKHVLALDEDTGEVWAWGWNEFGQLGQGDSGNTYDTPVKVMEGVGDPLDDIVYIDAGFDFSLAIKDDGLRLDYGSPCLNTADANLAPPRDILDFYRPYPPDMGAYEGPTTVVVMCWIDETKTESYYSNETMTMFNADITAYNDLLEQYPVIVKSGCLVPCNPGEEYPPGIEPVLPEGYDIPEDGEIEPADPPEGISIYEFPRTYVDPEPVLDDFITHFNRIRGDMVPDYLCLSVDTSGSMMINLGSGWVPAIEPHYSKEPADNFIDWVKDNYPNTQILRRDTTEWDHSSSHTERWFYEMKIQLQDVVNGNEL